MVISAGKERDYLLRSSCNKNIYLHCNQEYTPHFEPFLRGNTKINLKTQNDVKKRENIKNDQLRSKVQQS